MSTNQRGAVIFLVIIVMVGLFCYFVPFVLLPKIWGVGMALPVIQVPGEIYVEGWPSAGFEFTNTLAGTLLADALVLLVALVAWRKSKGWTKEVPGRFQSFVELLADFVYGLVKQMAGTSRRSRSTLFPLVASIFFFLLVANWLELVPGVDSIGILHCAGGYGDQTAAYPRSDAGWLPGDSVYQIYNPKAMSSGYTARAEDYHACEAVLLGHAEAPDLAGTGLEIPDDPTILYTVEEGDTLASIVEKYDGYHITLDDIFINNEDIHDDADLAPLVGEEITLAVLVGARAINPNHNLFMVTPFIRAAATDLNLTLGLALISFFAIQYFGVAEQGLGYFQKFVNLHALGNLKKKPMGLIDFAVGLFEIISEFSKVISLAFRLFGNIFAGQLLLFIMAFLVATLLPGVFYGLEIIVGAIQALVFAVLTLVFSAQAMEGHHGGDEEHEH